MNNQNNYLKLTEQVVKIQFLARTILASDCNSVARKVTTRSFSKRQPFSGQAGNAKCHLKQISVSFCV